MESIKRRMQSPACLRAVQLGLANGARDCRFQLTGQRDPGIMGLDLSRPRMVAIRRNFLSRSASNPMSSLSGAQFEADDPAGSGEADGPAENTEVELARKARSGDRGAYGRLVLLYQDRLYNAIVRMVGDRDESRELTQETFTRGLARIDGFRGEASPYTWLFRIATNLCISRLRKVQRRRTFSLDGGSDIGSAADQASSLIDRIRPDAADRPDQAAERAECNRQVLAALGRLDPEYRAVLVMRDIEGFDYQQMANVLGLPLGTLKSRLFRARLALRDELKAYLK